MLTPSEFISLISRRIYFSRRARHAFSIDDVDLTSQLLSFGEYFLRTPKKRITVAETISLTPSADDFSALLSRPDFKPNNAHTRNINAGTREDAHLAGRFL